MEFSKTISENSGGDLKFGVCGIAIESDFAVSMKISIV